MRRIIFLVLTIALMMQGFSRDNPITRHLKVIEVSGNGYQRGYMHGQALKKEIAELVAIWKNDLASSMQINADSFISRFLAYSDFLPASKKYTPDILDEVKGIAEGSGQSFNDIFAFQLVDEYWVYQDQLKRDSTKHHCSGLGVAASNGRPAFVSQNLDVESWMDGYQIILHVKRNGATPEQYLLSSAGLVALNGLNENGIGVCVNTLMTLSASRDGLPVAFMIRGILSQPDAQSALAFLQNTPHASGQNYILGTVDSVYDFEASAKKVVRFQPEPGIVYHTNHPLVNDDIKPGYQDYYQRFLAGSTQNQNSEVRFATLKKRTDQTSVKDDVFIKATLRSKDDFKNPVCRPHREGSLGFTFGSVILTLSNIRSMQVTAGPPDESDYQVFSFKK